MSVLLDSHRTALLTEGRVAHERRYAPQLREHYTWSDYPHLHVTLMRAEAAFVERRFTQSISVRVGAHVLPIWAQIRRAVTCRRVSAWARRRSNTQPLLGAIRITRGDEPIESSTPVAQGWLRSQSFPFAALRNVSIALRRARRDLSNGTPGVSQLPGGRSINISHGALDHHDRGRSHVRF